MLGLIFIYNYVNTGSGHFDERVIEFFGFPSGKKTSGMYTSRIYGLDGSVPVDSCLFDKIM